MCPEKRMLKKEDPKQMRLDLASCSRKLKITEAQTNKSLFCSHVQEVWRAAISGCVSWCCGH